MLDCEVYNLFIVVPSRILVGRQLGWPVYLDQPSLQILINQNVKSKQFKAAVSRGIARWHLLAEI